MTNTTGDANNCPDFLIPFNANTETYNAGTTLVSFTVSRQNSSGAWSFNFSLTGGAAYNNVTDFPSAYFVFYNAPQYLPIHSPGYISIHCNWANRLNH